ALGRGLNDSLSYLHRCLPRHRSAPEHRPAERSEGVGRATLEKYERASMTVAHVYTVAFQGIEAREVDVQVHIASYHSAESAFAIVGLADRSISESRERVRAALSAIGLAFP